MSLLVEIGRVSKAGGLVSTLRLPTETKDVEESIRDASEHEQVLLEGKEVVLLRKEGLRRDASRRLVAEISGAMKEVLDSKDDEEWPRLWKSSVIHPLLSSLKSAGETRGEEGAGEMLLVSDVRRAQRLRVEETASLSRELTVCMLDALWGKRNRSGQQLVSLLRRIEKTTTFEAENGGEMVHWMIGVMYGALDAMDSLFSSLSGELASACTDSTSYASQEQAWSAVVTQTALTELCELSRVSGREQECEGKAGNLRERAGRLFDFLVAVTQFSMELYHSSRSFLTAGTSSPAECSASQGNSLLIVDIEPSAKEGEELLRAVNTALENRFRSFCIGLLILQGTFDPPSVRERPHAGEVTGPSLCKPWQSSLLSKKLNALRFAVEEVFPRCDNFTLQRGVAWLAAQVEEVTKNNTDSVVTSWPSRAPSLPFVLQELVQTVQTIDCGEGALRQLVAFSLQAIEDWQEQNKVIGVECLHDVFLKGSPSPDLSAAVFDQAIKCNTYRNLPFLQRLYPLLVEMLSIESKTVSTSILSESHPVVRLLHLSIDELERSCNATFRRIFAVLCHNVLSIAGVHAVPYFERLVRALAPFIRWPDEVLVKEGLLAMQELLKQCWPRAAVHSEQVLAILSEAAADLFLNFNDKPNIELTELLEETALLLKSCCAAAGKSTHFEAVIQKYTVVGGHCLVEKRASEPSRRYWAACISSLTETSS